MYEINVVGDDRSIRFKKLILRVKIDGKIKTIHLEPTQQLLANIHLPVWISSNNHGELFQRSHHIVKEDVGEFTMYHDYTTRSAVVYFHERGVLEGVIDTKYKIEALPIKKLHQVYVIKSQHSRFLKVGKFFQSLYRLTHSEMTSDICRNPKHKVYPELLIAISHDMFQDIETNSPLSPGVKTISHVLTVYNIVDMMYRYVKSVGIFLNIAGIVIEGRKNEWGFEERTDESAHVDANKINDLVSEYFRGIDDHIPRHSYDYVIYNTRTQMLGEENRQHFGIATDAGLTPMFYPHNYPYRYNVAVRDYQSCQHYVTIAHELAHVFGALHDELRFWFFIPSCERSIMTTYHCPERYCTKWSNKVEEQFIIFFSSPAHCILRNEPRSLFPSGPRPMISQLEQCKCYGFENFHDTSGDALESRCHMGLRCFDKNGKEERKLPWPKDGSDCNRNQGKVKKVCWAEECVTISQHETSMTP